MQFKISGEKTDGMSAGREKIDDGEKDLAVGPAMFFFREKLAGVSWLFWQLFLGRDGIPSGDVACSHAD